MRLAICLLWASLSLWSVTRKEVVFRETPQGTLKMTIFYPPDWKPADQRPGIVFFFGGGFVSGEPRQFFSKAAYLSGRGLVAASAEYRIKNKHQTTVEDALSDCQAAFAWLKSHAAEHGLHPDKLSAGGGSAGGACALSILRAGLRPASFVLFNPAALDSVEPDESLPPTILFFGTADRLYPAAQKFLAKAPKNRVELFVAKDQPHGFFNDRGDGSWHSSTTYLADQFLAKLGFTQGQPTIPFPPGSQAILFPEAILQPSGPGRPRPLPPGISSHLNVEYKPGLLLDIYTPAGPPRPLIVWIHGGAWIGGNKENPASLLLLPQGFAAASIRYRLSQQAPMPAALEDVKAAIRFLRANAASYGYDASKIGVWGASAGGHLAAMIGVAGSGEDKVQAVVDWFGPSDFLRAAYWPARMDHIGPSSAIALFLGALPHQNPDIARRAAPLAYVSSDDPPFLIQHGDSDELVPLEQSELLADALRRAKVPVEFDVFPGAAHGGPAFTAPTNLAKIAAFFAKYLR